MSQRCLRMKRLFVVCAGLGLVLGFSSIADASPRHVTTKSPAPKTVKVALREFTVKAVPGAVAAGRVHFKVKNNGSVEHEMVVVRTNGSPLRTNADGSVDEDRIIDSASIGEVEELKRHKTKTLKTDLSTGTYTLFCNIVETDGTKLSHYAQGMHTQFTVTATSGR